MSLFNTQRKKTTNPTAGETKLAAKPDKVVTTKKVASTDKPVKAAKATATVVVAKNSVIVKPRITEKATALAEKGIYTFDVAMRSNSQQIAQEIRKTYKVTPIKVSVAAIPRKSMFVRGKKGSTTVGKKAYVYLKKGDKIEFN